MLVKLFTLRFDERLDAFDDEGVRRFMSDKDVKAVREHLFVKDGAPYWALMVSYAIPPGNGQPAAARKDGAARPDYRSILGEEDWSLFNALRDWRAEKAKAEGVPPYLILNNKELAQVARQRPGTLSALGQIRGVGAAKVKRFGAQLLALVGTAQPDDGGQREDAARAPAAGAGADAGAGNA